MDEPSIREARPAVITSVSLITLPVTRAARILTVIQLPPLLLQRPQLLFTLLIRVVRLQIRRQRAQSPVDRHHDPERIRRRRRAQRESSSGVRKLGRGETAGAAVQVAGHGRDEVADGADGVEGREEELGSVEEVLELFAGVLGGHGGELEHGHRERRLESGGAWGSWPPSATPLSGGDAGRPSDRTGRHTEVGGGRYAYEGLEGRHPPDVATGCHLGAVAMLPAVRSIVWAANGAGEEDAEDETDEDTPERGLFVPCLVDTCLAGGSNGTVLRAHHRLLNPRSM